MSRWYVAYTQPGSEILAQGQLVNQGFEVYFPRYIKLVRRARTENRIAAPLFPRYLFVSIDTESQRWRSINSTRGISYLITMNERPCAVPDGVVEEIKSRENADRLIEIPKLLPFKPGTKLEITTGAFADQVGSFLRLDKNDRVMVLLGMLGRKVKVLVQNDAVRAYG